MLGGHLGPPALGSCVRAFPQTLRVYDSPRLRTAVPGSFAGIQASLSQGIQRGSMVTFLTASCSRRSKLLCAGAAGLLSAWSTGEGCSVQRVWSSAEAAASIRHAFTSRGVGRSWCAGVPGSQPGALLWSQVPGTAFPPGVTGQVAWLPGEVLGSFSQLAAGECLVPLVGEKLSSEAGRDTT